MAMGKEVAKGHGFRRCRPEVLKLLEVPKRESFFNFSMNIYLTPLNLFVVPEASNIIRSNWDPAPSHPLPGLLRGVLR